MWEIILGVLAVVALAVFAWESTVQVSHERRMRGGDLNE